MTRGKWRAIGVVGAAAVLVVALALAIPEFLGRDSGAQRSAPIAVLSGDEPRRFGRRRDGAGDNGERFLPVPAPLDDDRVVDAFGPLAKLSCSATTRLRRHAARAQPTRSTRRLRPMRRRAGTRDGAVARGRSRTAGAAGRARCERVRARSRQRSRTCRPNVPRCCAIVSIACRPASRNRCASSRARCSSSSTRRAIAATPASTKGLEALYRKYKGRGLVVVGFPSNDFGGQEPGSNQEIAQFCRLTYGVQFPMFEKSSVTKVSANPLFASLSASTGVAPQWNFYKYVVDRNGQAVAGYGSRTTPDDRELVRTVERLLAEKPKG